MGGRPHPPTNFIDTYTSWPQRRTVPSSLLYSDPLTSRRCVRCLLPIDGLCHRLTGHFGWAVAGPRSFQSADGEAEASTKALHVGLQQPLKLPNDKNDIQKMIASF